MNHERQAMLSIGSFSSASQLSLKALRLYDQLGILSPSYVDPDSGYRYYDADRLATARMIRIMRAMEMPLATIRQVLAAAPADAEPLVRGYLAAREQRMAQARELVHDLVALLTKETPTMSLDVNVRTEEPMTIASITRRVKVDQLSPTIAGSLETLFGLAEQQGQPTTGAPFGLYHGPINDDDDGPIEICVPVASALAAAGDAASRVLPGGRLASVRVTGSECDFPAILKAYDAVFDWVQRSGYKPAEPPREIWHSGPGDAAEMEVALRFE